MGNPGPISLAAKGIHDPAPVVRAGPLEMDFSRRAARADGQSEALRLMPREWYRTFRLRRRLPGS
jgi:hypothetical protein